MKYIAFSFFILMFSLTGLKLSAQDWQFDYNQAQAVAQNEHKPIILVFQGSDWCAPCIKLEKKIWQSDTFKTYAKAHFVMLKADFPRRKKNRLPEEQQKKNDQLAEKYNRKGQFPKVVVLNDKGVVLGVIGFKRRWSPQQYIDWINSLQKEQ